MHQKAEDDADREDTADGAHLRSSRRIERFDIVVAAALLVLLIFGWAVDFAPMGQWTGTHLLTALRFPHA